MIVLTQSQPLSHRLFVILTSLLHFYLYYVCSDAEFSLECQKDTLKGRYTKSSYSHYLVH
jgi:hypothetical protein